MNEELTNDWIEGALSTARQVTIMCSSTVERLATALLEERAEPRDDVWKYAPYWAKGACVIWDDGEGQKFTRLYNSERYTRELPKTRARKYAENLYRKLSFERISDNQSIDAIEELLNKYAEELTNTKETN